MARTIRDNQLGSRTARQSLKIRSKPYFRGITEGCHLGYRRLRGADGSWIVRIYAGDQKYLTEKIGIADDLNDADGAKVLSFTQAADKARELHARRARQEAGIIAGPYTVADAMSAYVEYLDHRGKKTDSVEKAITKYVAEPLGKVDLAKLTSERLRKWLADIATMPARGRASDARARKVSANRTLTTLKAALQLAFAQNKVASDSAWRQVKRFENVDAPRERFLSVAEAKRLINAADAEFRSMIEAALATGCRYGELCNLQVRDFHPDSRTLHIRTSKSGKGRKVVLTDEGFQLFQSLVAGRSSVDPLIRRNDGTAFGPSHQIRRMRELCARAGIQPAVGFHQLRHTFASLCVQAGIPMAYVATALGHASTVMTEKHYAHLAPSHFAETLRQHAPTFGIGKSNVRSIR